MDYHDFLESFNHIEKYLKKYTKSIEAESFNDLLFRANDHPMVKLYTDDLHLFRKLRNLIIHQTNDFNDPIATPSQEIIERIQFVEKEITDPTDVSVFQKEITVFQAHDSIEVALNITAEKGITKFPIYEEGRFIGLATTQSVMKYLQMNLNHNQITLTGNLKDLLLIEQLNEYELVAQTLSVYDAWYKFRNSKGKINALIVTKNAQSDETIEAVITYTDLLKFMFNHKEYVFNV